jgi:hypothetical protein
MPEMDYEKLYANSRKHSVVAAFVGPSAPTTTLGITDIAQPAADELNNTGGVSGIYNATPAISWNDWGFGLEASETNNEPSLADLSSYEEFGASNFGGTISYYRPETWADNSNLISIVEELTDQPGQRNDIAVRIDGDKAWNQPVANGDYVSAYRVESGSESNTFAAGESKRRTVGYMNKGDFAHYTVVGPHTIVPIPAPTDPWDAGRKARLRASVQGREYTNALEFRSSDATVVDIYKGGFYEVTGTAGDTATITIEDVEAGTSVDVEVTVTAP